MSRGPWSRVTQFPAAEPPSPSRRLIDVEWEQDTAGTPVASIEVKALDPARLLSDVSTALADHHVDIIACNTVTDSDRISKMRFDIELGDRPTSRA